MRDIKFRVWDKDLKYMHILGEDVHDSIYFSENNRAYYYNLQNGCGSLTENSSYKLMQYTGLKDEKGKEIYEGDILKIPEWLQQDNQDKCICVYAEEHQTSEIIGFGLYIKDGYSGEYKILVPSDEWDEFQVIGNIYENPELLEE